MRDQYAGDVSDYLKFAYLRTVVPDKAALGVAWYYLDGHDGRADGRHEEYLDDPTWRALDPDLFDRLARRRERSIAELEALELLPRGTRFHREPVPARRDRPAWLERARRELDGAAAVFVDPDNGVSRPGVVRRKSATADEVRQFCEGGRLVLLIRFPHRLTSHDAQLAEHHATFRDRSPLTIRTCVRVPNAGGGTSPRIRWFTALNAGDVTVARAASFAARLTLLPDVHAIVQT